MQEVMDNALLGMERSLLGMERSDNNLDFETK